MGEAALPPPKNRSPPWALSTDAVESMGGLPGTSVPLTPNAGMAPLVPGFMHPPPDPMVWPCPLPQPAATDPSAKFKP